MVRAGYHQGRKQHHHRPLKRKRRIAGRLIARQHQMRTLAWISGLILVVFIVRDFFITLMVPGRVRRPFRLMPLYFRASWELWANVGRRIRHEESRERLLSVFGPFAMLCLIALWAAGMLIGFGLLQFGLAQSSGIADFPEFLYASGVRIFTLGAEEPAGSSSVSKALAVIEAGTGLALITTVITYLPVLYQLFSRRETHVILLDERAGAPVGALSLICAHARRNALDRLNTLLASWEQWSAELLESHVSYPMLSYYRSEHSDQSWLAAMAVVMDTCALRIAGAGGFDEFQAERTLAMCINALRNIGVALHIHPLEGFTGRLSPPAFRELTQQLLRNGLPAGGYGIWDRLSSVRNSYEPLLAAIADYLVIELPAWVPTPRVEKSFDPSRAHEFPRASTR